jgi:hypothetical protein
MSLILSGTDGLSDVDGSAATPAIRGTDANTGIFFPAADTIAFAEGGAEAMRIDSSGNLLVGTTSQAPLVGVGKYLTLYNNSNTTLSIQSVDSGNDRNATLELLSSGSGSSFSQIVYGDTRVVSSTPSPLVFASYVATVRTERMRLDTSGNLGIGTTSTGGYALAIQRTNDNALMKITAVTSGGAGIDLINAGGSEISYVGASGNNVLTFRTGGTERARIDSSGNVLVGTTDSSIVAGTGMKFDLNGTNPQIAIVGTATTSAQLTYSLYSSGASAYRFYVNYAGTINATSATITAISDQRLKENIRDLDDGLDKILALKPRKFDWKEGKGANIKDARGFIAQEFETVFPDMIEEWKDPTLEGEEPYKAVNANLIPTLVKAIQEQQALIISLTARITALETQNADNPPQGETP